MKIRFLVLVFIAIYSTCFAQQSESNRYAKISDSIQNEQEIRIYKGRGITNSGTIFRIYKINSTWKAETIQWFLPKQISSDEFENIEPIVKTFSAYEGDFLNFQIRNIQFLPDEKYFEYKKQKREIVYDEEFKEFAFSTTSSISVVDGTGYEVIYKNGKLKNKFNYNNPRTYLEKYPEIDELKSFVEILNYIETTFKIKF